ncbi:MAG: hypothetical protein PHO75_02240 [Candidatus Shapirobacteria bacterium]|nr:hypothetical protein [Candidatus Shapirobacteria bacterium]
MVKKTIIYQFDKKGNFLKVWDSYFLIKKKNPSFDIRHINQSCKNLRTSSNGFIWTFDKNENLSERIKKINSKKIKVIVQYTKKGKLLTVWNSVNELIRILTPNLCENSKKKPYKSRTIRQCCQGRRKSAYGFVWKYREDFNF